MRADELDFDRLVTRPQPGVLSLRGGRAIVVDAAASWRLAEELEDTLGPAAARGVLTRHSFQSGYQEATRLRTYYDWDSDLEWLHAGARVLAALGLGAVALEEVVVDRARGVFRVVAAVEGAHEAALSRARRGPSAGPVCDRLAGWLTGFGSAFLGDDVLFVEEACAAQGEGAGRCRFVGRLAGEWGEAGQRHQALYRRDAIGERLARRDREVVAQAVTIHEQELALAATRRVEEASRLKSEFLANVSHELRTPLNSIIGYADLLLSRLGAALPATPRQNLERILANAEHLRALIDDVLDLSRVEAGHLALAPTPLDPRPLIDRCAEDARVLLAGKPVELVVAPGPLPPVLADATRLRQCLVNVLGNAVKFTAQGSIRIEGRPLAGRRGGQARGLLAIAVSDTGPGIAPAHQALIFEPFRQVDASASRAHGGTGLGLAIARALLEGMGGEVHVTSALGVGSTFTLLVPLADEAPPGGAPPPAGPPPPELDVLLIDDDPALARACREALAADGARLRLTAECDPLRALALARTRPPAAVVLELRLQGLDGLEVLRLLREDPRTRGVPVVCCSARDDLAAALAGGADAALGKPAAPAALREALARALRARP